MPQLLWCVCPVHHSPSSSSHKSCQGSIGIRPHPQIKKQYSLWKTSLYYLSLSQNTYFSFQGQFYEQVVGVAIGSPVSPIVATLYMEYFEQKALRTAPHPPGSSTGMWMTHLSSKRKSINRTSNNRSTVLTLPFSLQWRTIRRMGHLLLGHHC